MLPGPPTASGSRCCWSGWWPRIVFLAIRLVPGDPAELLLSQGGARARPGGGRSNCASSSGSTGRCCTSTLPTSARLLRGDLGEIASGWQPGRRPRSRAGCRARWS